MDNFNRRRFLEGLKAAGMTELVVDLGDARIVPCLLSPLKLSAAQQADLVRALATKDASALQQLTADFPPATRDALLSLLQAYGGTEVLTQAEFRDRSLRKADRLTSADRKLVRSKNITMDGQLSGPFFEIVRAARPMPAQFTATRGAPSFSTTVLTEASVLAASATLVLM